MSNSRNNSTCTWTCTLARKLRTTAILGAAVTRKAGQRDRDLFVKLRICSNTASLLSSPALLVRVEYISAVCVQTPGPSNWELLFHSLSLSLGSSIFYLSSFSFSLLFFVTAVRQSAFPCSFRFAPEAADSWTFPVMRLRWIFLPTWWNFSPLWKRWNDAAENLSSHLYIFLPGEVIPFSW